MHLGHNLELKQDQKIILTPELKQSLKILQYNQIEMNDFINEALIDNPVLERVDSSINDLLLSLSKNPSSPNTASLAKDADLPDDLKYYSHVTQSLTLKEHLFSQLGCMTLSPRSKAMINYLIDSINDKGYLESDLQSLSESSNYTLAGLEVSLDLIQLMDPPGVGARNLSECLLLQFANKGIENPLAESIVTNDMNDLANNRLSKIVKKYGISMEKLQETIKLIRSFDPKPGSAFRNQELTPYVKADIVIDWDELGYHMTIDQTYSCPSLHISSYYTKLLTAPSIDDQTLEYIKGKVTAANMIIRNITQRQQTMTLVAEAILEHQKAFFTDDKGSLKALKMKDIAQVINMHESTVSRTINGKYLLCPHGLYPLRHFFQQGLENIDGEVAAADDIKNRIQSLIQNEDGKKPLSDQKIVDLLLKEHISISRRTVAKYRTQLNIPATSKRKKF